jgi:hypothetical protein
MFIPVREGIFRVDVDESTGALLSARWFYVPVLQGPAEIIINVDIASRDQGFNRAGRTGCRVAGYP